MKLVLKSILIFLIFLYSLVYFLPKENLYYFALEKLQNEKILINSKKIKDKFFSLNIKDSVIFYDSIKALEVSNIDLNIYLFTNSLNISNISLDDMLKRFLPSKIKTLEVSYTILNPLVVNIKANLVQAKVYGIFDITSNTVTLYLKPSKQFLKLYKDILKNMKKQENGEYKIEYKL